MGACEMLLLEDIAYRLMKKGWSALRAVKIAFITSILLHVAVTLAIWASFILMYPVILVPLLYLFIISITLCLSIALGLYVMLPSVALFFARPLNVAELGLLNILNSVMEKVRGLKRVQLLIRDKGGPNAYSVSNVFKRAIILSKSICTILSEEELKAVMGHEIGHFSRLDRALLFTRFLVICTGIFNIALATFLIASLLHLNITLAIVMSIIMFVPAVTIDLSLSRLREHYADMCAVKVSSSEALASALRKMEMAWRSGGEKNKLLISLLLPILRALRTHPLSSDRIYVAKHYHQELLYENAQIA